MIYFSVNKDRKGIAVPTQIAVTVGDKILFIIVVVLTVAID
jgi:hypothetical protein